MDKNEAQNEGNKFRIEVAARRPSFTQRLIGVNREWMSSYYKSQDDDDQLYGHGFNDQVDDFVPGVIEFGRRRRNSSMSSDVSMDSLNDQGQGRVRSGSISDRVAGMQVMNSMAKKPTTATTTTRNEIGDINDYSVLF